MTLYFEGVTNKPYSMIMAALFTLKDGTEVAVGSEHETFMLDSSETYELEDGSELCKFYLSWKLCYIFDPDAGDGYGNEDGDIIRYLTPADVQRFDGATLTAYLLHEDTVPDYTVEFTSFHPGCNPVGLAG